MTKLDIPGFVRRVLELMAEGADVDGIDLEEAAIEHGLLVERPATAEDCETEWTQEYGIDPGDPITPWSDALKAYLK